MHWRGLFLQVTKWPWEGPVLPYKRTTMVCIRTSVSLISYASNIYKIFVFRDEHVASAVIIGPRLVVSGGEPL